MPQMIFINLPVADLDRAVAFYEAIGCVKNSQFSNDRGAMLVWSDTISFMLLTHDFFRTFTPKQIAVPGVAEALFCLSRDSRAEVDDIVARAIAAGGKADLREAQDMRYMYGRTFEDLDGHIFEPMWMDLAAMEQSQAEPVAA